MRRGAVICSKHDAMNKNDGFDKIARRPLLVPRVLFCVSQSIAEAGGAEAAPAGGKVNGSDEDRG